MKPQRLASDFSVGFVLFVATVVIVASLFLVGDGQGLFRDSARFFVRCPSAMDLREGSAVKLGGGIAVGAVESIEFPPELDSSDVLLTVSIDKRYLPRIRGDSFAWLQSQGLMGDTELHVRVGTERESPLPAGSYIRFRGRGMLDSLAGEEFSESTTGLVKNMVSLLEEINRGQGTLGQLLKNPELYDNLNAFTRSMAATTREVESLTRQVTDLLAEVRSQKGVLGKALFSEEYASAIATTLSEVKAMAGDLRELAAGVRSGKGTAGKLFTDPGLHDTAQSALQNVARLSERLETTLARAQSESSVVGRLLADGELGQQTADLTGRLSGSLEHLERILGRIEAGEGSLGVLLHDPSIAASLRDIFLGVQEAGLMRNVVQNAERAGRERYLRDGSLARKEAEEVRRVRALSAIERQGGPETGTPVPASGPEERKPSE